MRHAVPRRGLVRVPHGVTEVQELAEPGLARVPAHDPSLDLSGDRDCGEEGAEIARAHALETARELRDRVAVREEGAFHHLGEARRKLPRR